MYTWRPATPSGVTPSSEIVRARPVPLSGAWCRDLGFESWHFRLGDWGAAGIRMDVQLRMRVWVEGAVDLGVGWSVLLQM